MNKPFQQNRQARTSLPEILEVDKAALLEYHMPDFPYPRIGATLGIFGSSGSGKTRLATHLARSAAHADYKTCYISFEGGADFIKTQLQTLKSQNRVNVQNYPSKTGITDLIDFINKQPSMDLLVIDSFSELFFHHSPTQYSEVELLVKLKTEIKHETGLILNCTNAPAFATMLNGGIIPKSLLHSVDSAVELSANNQHGRIAKVIKDRWSLSNLSWHFDIDENGVNSLTKL